MDDLHKKFLDELEEDLEGVSGESEFSKESKKKITKANKNHPSQQRQNVPDIYNCFFVIFLNFDDWFFCHAAGWQDGGLISALG